MLAEMGEHQLMIRDYLRHSDLHVIQKLSTGNDKKQNASPKGSSWMPFCQGACCREANQPCSTSPRSSFVRVIWTGRNSESADGKRLGIFGHAGHRGLFFESFHLRIFLPSLAA
jgi:hypothetical protein